MTDTPTDTAPEAITQAEEQAFLDCLREEFDAVEVALTQEIYAPAARAYRRLTSHSAEEGLLWSDPLKLGSDTWERPAWLPADALLKHANGREGRASSWAFGPTSEFSIALVSTPPSDAGSTTRSGGEGVPAGMKAYGPDHPDYPNSPRDQARLGLPVRRSGASAVGLDWRHHAPGHHRYPHDIVAYWPDAALATTPSPDASPDSGEADNVIDRARNVVAEFIECARLRGDNDLPHPCDDAKLWTARMIEAWAELEALADEDPLAALARPSPSPAIVKEAGEVAELRQQNVALRDALEEILTPLERAAAAMVGEGMVPDQNAEAAFDRARAALSASNAAQVLK